MKPTVPQLPFLQAHRRTSKMPLLSTGIWRGNFRQSRVADLGCVALLLLLAAMILLLRNSAVPMQIWDESRNANNALEMSRSGYSLVTYFHGLPDHWSTKPPLLIWLMALCFRLGLPPLLAVRLPSIMAAISSVLLVFFFARICLRDRLAGLLAGLTLLAAPLFVGWHTGRTGDFDSLVVFFTLAYALAFWCYIETSGRARTQWVAVAGVAVALNVLTKGVGGLLALPALLLYAILRGRSRRVLLDWRLGLTLLGIALICTGYYGLREHFDPGYLEAVWRNEFTGRYLAVNEEHTGGSLYYFRVLAGRFEPGFILLPLAATPFFRPDQRRRSAALLCLLTSAVLLGVLTGSQTKIFWYLAPATPFLALAVGLGVSDSLAWLRAREQKLPALFRPRIAYAAVAAIFGVANLAAVYYYQIGVERKLAGTYMEGRYGPFLNRVRHSGVTRHLVLLDYGSSEAMIDSKSGDFANYSPEADFYANVERARGMQVQVVVPDHDLPSGSWIVTCDPRSNAWLTGRYHVAVVLRSNPWCTLEQIRGAK
jgi:4-amino-4-deoxy-L-arabinose transferase-like glycosyltransferase